MGTCWCGCPVRGAGLVVSAAGPPRAGGAVDGGGLRPDGGLGAHHGGQWPRNTLGDGRGGHPQSRLAVADVRFLAARFGRVCDADGRCTLWRAGSCRAVADRRDAGRARCPHGSGQYRDLFGLRAGHVVFGWRACFGPQSLHGRDVGHAQALAHLVQNAIDASPPSEPVTVHMRSTPEDAVIEVIDKGCGMSPQFVHNELFKPFASTKQGGFGVGAFEARALITAMGGRIEVQSREGEGTTFRILMPLARDSINLSIETKAQAA
ncbi:hypothetical protein D5I55_11900 [Chakrabartia godavariana]|nr:hypothetical protein D5I55_11900 [Chakrabartia godavariana]